MHEDKKIVLSNGEEFQVHCEVRGLRADYRGVDRMTVGWDGHNPLDAEVALPEIEDDPTRFTSAERREIADAMVERWRAWAVRDVR